MTSALKTCFEEFVRNVDGFEEIDCLLKDRDPHGKRRADYLFLDRTIIVEQKVLETDPSNKLQNYLDRLMKENRIIGWGTGAMDRDDFYKLPDGETLYKSILHKTTSRIEEIASLADKQTRDTREIFGIPDAAGILIILNEAAQSLISELLEYRIQDLFKIDSRDGSVRYPHNDMIMVISELHPVHIGLMRYLPTKRYINSTARQRERVIAFSDRLTAGWAAVNRALLISETDLRRAIS